MAKRLILKGKVASAIIAVLISVLLSVASRMWPRSAEDKLVESSFAELIDGFSAGDSLKARSLFALPEVFTDAKLEELATLIKAGNRTVDKSVYLGSMPGKIGDHPVLSSTFLLKFSDKSENLLNVVSEIGSWSNSKPFIMSMSLSDTVAQARSSVAFMPSENGIRSYFLLLMGVAALIVSTYAVYRALWLRPKYWFAWLLLSLLGVLRFRLNWATEDYDLQLLSVSVPVFEVVRTSVLSPFLFFFGVPVGAVAFLNHTSDLEETRKHAHADAD